MKKKKFGRIDSSNVTKFKLLRPTFKKLIPTELLVHDLLESEMAKNTKGNIYSDVIKNLYLWTIFWQFKFAKVLCINNDLVMKQSQKMLIDF